MANERELLEEIRDLMRQNNRSGGRDSGRSSTSSDSGSSGSSGGGIVSGLGDAASKAADGLFSVWQGSGNVAKGFGALTSTLEQNGGLIGKALGKAAGEIGDAVFEVNKANRKAVEYGAGQGNDLGKFDEAVKGARMTHEEYADMLRDTTREVEGLGSTANKSQENLLKVFKGVQESNIGRKLQELGVSADELNRITEASVAFNKGKDMSTDIAQKEAVEAALRMAAAMDENTRISGLSRRAQEDDLKKRSEDAATQMALSKMDPEAKKRYDAAMADMANMPDAVKKAFTEQVTGGIRTSEGSATIAAMGDAGPELLKAAEGLKAANSPEARAENQKQIAGAITSFTKYQNTDSYKDLGIVGTGAAADQARAMWTGNLERDKINAKIDEEKNKGNTVDEATARQMILQEVRNEQKKLDAEGKPQQGGELAHTINKADSALKDMTAGAASAFHSLTDKTNELIKAKQGEIDQILRPRKQSEADPISIGKEIGEGIKKAINFDAGPLKPAFEKGQKLYQDFQDSHKGKEPLTMETPTGSFADGTPELNKFLSGGGSFNDMFTSFDPKGELAVLHGKELVANESQMSKLFQQIMPQMPSSSKETTTDTPPIDINGIKDTVATQVNSANPQSADFNKTFAAVNTEMKNVSKELSEVADKLKNINFEPALKNLSDHTAKVMEKVAAPQDTSKKEEPKQQETKKEEVKPAETKPVEEKFAALSKTIETVTGEIQTGGIRTKEGAEKMASLGPAGAELEKAIKAHKDATTDQQKADAINAEKTAIAKIKDYQQSKEFINQQIYQTNVASKTGFKDIDPIKSTEELNKKLFGSLTGVKGLEEKEKPKEQPKAEEKKEEKKEDKGFFDTVSSAFSKVGSSITDLFKDDKPAFASGNVKYEEISQEEKDAANKRAQEGIGKVDNSPEAIAAQKAELDRQKNSGLYKQKEPEKPNTNELAKPVETKEDAHVKEMYKKFGLESFKDYNTRLDAESKAASNAIKPESDKKTLATSEEIAKHVADKTSQPDLTKPFSNISDQLSGAFSKTPMLNHEEIFAKAQEMFKSPDISGMLGPVGDTFSKMFEENKLFPETTELKTEETTKAEEKPKSISEILKSESDALADSMKGAKTPDIKETNDDKTEDKGFFDTISDTFSKAGASISDMFTDSTPKVAIEDVKSDESGKTPEQKAEDAKVQSALQNLENKYSKEPDTSKLADKGKIKEPEKPIVPAIPKVKSKEDQHVDDMYKKFGIERFDDYNARKSAEVKSSHAQIKDISKERASITTPDITPPKPVEQSKPVEQPKPAEQPAVAAPVAKEVTLKDLHDALMQLNKTMGQMAQHTDAINNNSRKQVQATQSLSGNRYA